MHSFDHTFAMPSGQTFSIPPIEAFVQRYLSVANVSVDPFARNKTWATHTNDLNPDTLAQHHMDAEDFCKMLYLQGVEADLGLFDPPYSPRQISELYKNIGKEVGAKETQNAAMYKRVRDAMDSIIKPGGIVLSFGWNSNGMGKGRNYETVEMLIVKHGGAHNDTICIAEKKLIPPSDLFGATMMSISEGGNSDDGSGPERRKVMTNPFAQSLSEALGHIDEIDDGIERQCRHDGWLQERHGRRCPKCGTAMIDFGD